VQYLPEEWEAAMKKIECFIRPDKLDEVTDTLWDEGVSGLSVTSVMGFGNQRIRTGARLIEKFKLEVYVRDEQLEEVIEVIKRVARTGKMGDGKIAVLPAEDIFRIRTGEKGLLAI